MSAGAAMLAQTGLQMLGSIVGGYAQAGNLERGARAAEFNAGLYLKNAGRIRLEAGLNEDAHRRAARRVLGENRAAMFESGFQMSGSSMDVLEQAGVDAELDALNIRYQGDQEARSMELEASNALYEAAGMRIGAKTARRMAWLNAGTAAISGGSQYSQYKANQRYQQKSTAMMEENNRLLRTRGSPEY